MVLTTASPAAVSAPDEITAGAPITLLLDANTGQVLHSVNADRRFIPASITKVMTAYVAFDMIASGKLSPDQQLTLSERAAEEWYRTGSTMFHRVLASDSRFFAPLWYEVRNPAPYMDWQPGGADQRIRRVDRFDLSERARIAHHSH